MIAGITRVRNEEKIIANTLKHVSKLVDKIYIYDDCSTDNTVNICKKFGEVIEGKNWESTPEGRNQMEGYGRQIPLELATKEGADWIYCFDADEYADFDGIDFTADAYRLRLFDFYITEEDKNKNYLHRKWMGPEYRDILMLFRSNSEIRFYQREPRLPNNYKVEQKGWVKHYGKAISIAEWETTCDYYINHRGDDNRFKMFKNKWTQRKGKAIHTKSDFGNKLIQWRDRFNGKPLTKYENTNPSK
jgi:glycosyltransferase involved in cell wall biosynthesis